MPTTTNTINNNNSYPNFFDEVALHVPLEYIFAFLEVKDIPNVSLTNRAFAHACFCSDFWRNYFHPRVKKAAQKTLKALNDLHYPKEAERNGNGGEAGDQDGGGEERDSADPHGVFETRVLQDPSVLGADEQRPPPYKPPTILMFSQFAEAAVALRGQLDSFTPLLREVTLSAVGPLPRLTKKLRARVLLKNKFPPQAGTCGEKRTTNSTSSAACGSCTTRTTSSCSSRVVVLSQEHQIASTTSASSTASSETVEALLVQENRSGKAQSSCSSCSSVDGICREAANAKVKHVIQHDHLVHQRPTTGHDRSQGPPEDHEEEDERAAAGRDLIKLEGELVRRLAQKVILQMLLDEHSMEPDQHSMNVQGRGGIVKNAAEEGQAANKDDTRRGTNKQEESPYDEAATSSASSSSCSELSDSDTLLREKCQRINTALLLRDKSAALPEEKARAIVERVRQRVAALAAGNGSQHDVVSSSSSSSAPASSHDGDEYEPRLSQKEDAMSNREVLMLAFESLNSPPRNDDDRVDCPSSSRAEETNSKRPDSSTTSDEEHVLRVLPVHQLVVSSNEDQHLLNQLSFISSSSSSSSGPTAREQTHTTPEEEGPPTTSEEKPAALPLGQHELQDHDQEQILEELGHEVRFALARIDYLLSVTGSMIAAFRRTAETQLPLWTAGAQELGGVSKYPMEGVRVVSGELLPPLRLFESSHQMALRADHALAHLAKIVEIGGKQNTK
ncbi:unnamed protein product [Amoebophrya sp. A25]|nr:unnamed protein product [Amoebophrya sp. A25]|eukprot:GSA25T00018350001.1